MQDKNSVNNRVCLLDVRRRNVDPTTDWHRQNRKHRISTYVERGDGSGYRIILGGDAGAVAAAAAAVEGRFCVCGN